MAYIYWKDREPLNIEGENPQHQHPGPLPVDEQHALPMGLYFVPDGTTEAVRVDEANPLPVTLIDTPLKTVKLRTFQVSVATTATLIAQADTTRKSIKITNLTGTQAIYIGTGQEVSSSNGDYLHSSTGSNTTTAGTDDIWGIASVSTQTVTVMEEYNA